MQLHNLENIAIGTSRRSILTYNHPSKHHQSYTRSCQYDNSMTEVSSNHMLPNCMTHLLGYNLSSTANYYMSSRTWGPIWWSHSPSRSSHY